MDGRPCRACAARACRRALRARRRRGVAIATRAERVATIARRRGALSPSAVRDLLLAGLTLASGAVDAISFLALGKVFTAFQTGNLVFLGFGIAGAEGPDIPRVLASLAPFAAGVALAVTLIKPVADSQSFWPRRVSLALAVAVLAQAAFLVGWLVTSGRPGTGSGDVLVGLYALAMGIQSGAVMSLGVRGVFTTAATATIIYLASDGAGWSQSAAERRRLVAVLVALCGGAAAGGALLLHARELAPVVPLLASLLVLVAASRTLERSDGE